LSQAKDLTHLVEGEDLVKGTLYPPIHEIREVSVEIAKAVMKNAISQGLTPINETAIEALIAQELYDPTY
jgi:malic enzyme